MWQFYSMTIIKLNTLSLVVFMNVNVQSYVVLTFLLITILKLYSNNVEHNLSKKA